MVDLKQAGPHGYQVASINLQLLMTGYNSCHQVAGVLLIGQKWTLLCPHQDQDVVLKKETAEV